MPRRELNNVRRCHARAWGASWGPCPRCQDAFYGRQALLGSRRPRVRMREHAEAGRPSRHCLTPSTDAREVAYQA